MTVKLLTEHHLEFLYLKAESTLVKCHIVGNHMSRLKCDPSHMSSGSFSTKNLFPTYPAVLSHTPKILRNQNEIFHVDLPIEHY